MVNENWQYTSDGILPDPAHSCEVASETDSVTSNVNKQLDQHDQMESKPGDSSFLFMPSRKHIPTDNQDLLIEEKLTDSQ